MHRLPRVSPDVPIQYKDYTIPVGVRTDRFFSGSETRSSDIALGTRWNVSLPHALRSNGVPRTR